MQAKANVVNLSEVTAPAYKLFWRTNKTYVVCKGSRASGKSKHAALWIISNMMQYPLANTLVVRKVFDTMRNSVAADLIWALKRLKVEEYWDYPKKKSSALEFTYLPTGQKILFKGLDVAQKTTSISVPTGVLCWMWIEEAFEVDSEEDFDTLDESIRGELPEGYFKRVILIFNPWSESTWIKPRFFDNPAEDVLAMTTTFRDNPWLSETDHAMFRDMEINRPERFRVAGNAEWGVEGSVYFEEFRKDIHVIQPFSIPAHWKMYRVIDYGLDALACLYIAVDTQDVAYVIGEVYESNLIISDAAEAIKAAEPREERYITYAPPDLWSRTKDSGKMISETFYNCGVPLWKSDSSRIPGWMQVHERLRVIPDVDGGQTARLKIFSSCRDLIRCISTIKADEKNCNDVATDPHELTHLPDALRYWCVMHTAVPKEPDTRTSEQKMLDEHKKKVLGRQTGGRRIIR